MERVKISPQKKSECIAYALAHPEIAVKQLAHDLGIGNSTLSNWLQKARQNGQRAAGRSQIIRQERGVVDST